MAKKILIIEDEVALADSMKVGLTDAGYEADTAYDGEDGMVKVKSLTPDLVLLDLMLPKKDGMTILKEMRADSATADIPVMILSQLSDTEKISEGVSLGVVGYLVKVDFSLAEVVEKVKKALCD